jgi:hypothetical protein
MAIESYQTIKAQGGLAINSDTSSSDFYITAATIIPVLFLALVLEGGLWKWIQEQVSEASDPPIVIRIFVSLLQAFAVLVLIAGALGEITALYALWRTDFSSVLSDIVFSTTVLLVVFLAAELSLQIPGIFLVSLNKIELTLLADEKLRWSGICARSTRFPWPYTGGRLFVTDRRLVWTTPKAAGLLGAPRVEISSKELSMVMEGKDRPPPSLLEKVRSNFFYQRGPHCIIAVSRSGHKYTFFLDDEYTETLRYLKKLLPKKDDE